MTEFDYLVIGGGGTAGCIVAARLAEDLAISVGLVEWGPSDEAESRARAAARTTERISAQERLMGQACSSSGGAARKAARAVSHSGPIKLT